MNDVRADNFIWSLVQSMTHHQIVPR